MEPGAVGRNKRLVVEVIMQAVALGAMVWGLKVCLTYLDPYREQREQAKKRAAFLKEHLGRTLELNEFEQLLAAQVMNPAHIEVEMQDVSGLEDIVTDLEKKVLYPLVRPELYRTTLWKQAKGVLLYGPPGTGKTMLAKALAKQSRCFFLNITASSIMSKWLGDANRLVRAVFSLAAKLQPCIIFIDEVDAMLGKRGSSSEHEATLQVKTEFMQLWDGMESSRGQRVVVMGATNRPWMVDEAVLRRFTLMYEVGLPQAPQRASILAGYLRKHSLEVPGSVAPELLEEGGEALVRVAAATEGFSGSDLLELCSQAAQRVLADHLHEYEEKLEAGEPAPSMRPLGPPDLQEALQHVRPSSHRADEYSRNVGMGLGAGGGVGGGAGGGAGGGVGGAGGGAPLTPADLQAMMALLMQFTRT
ncbi:hypothetical protein HYH03_018047 [Edaphochlamys debaryana]|uniref:AAA+ ATPase domain-containing protein n=1 Tax=Edaphochlamys debaryana TaxID=47281 RepID=A0A835XMW5_9CHLO|nr:hypothetical protein HYH03_018047 [Edaphochlamys debaryana]|eukprot:KAG2483064.1 hypothetical protein HYH03_018047 [Edaphochlamys debaryana]